MVPKKPFLECCSFPLPISLHCLLRFLSLIWFQSICQASLLSALYAASRWDDPGSYLGFLSSGPLFMLFCLPRVPSMNPVLTLFGLLEPHQVFKAPLKVFSFLKPFLDLLTLYDTFTTVFCYCFGYVFSLLLDLKCLGGKDHVLFISALVHIYLLNLTKIYWEPETILSTGAPKMNETWLLFSGELTD